MLGSLRQLPNAISVVRIALIVPIAIELAHDQLQTTLLLVGVVALSDALDGFLARRFAWQTPLGAVLDPLADKLLLTTVLVTLTILGAVPLWLMVAAVARDLIIVGGAVAYRLWCGPLEIRPSLISKLNTLCQLAYIAGVVAERRFAVPAPWVVTLLGAAVLFTVVVSGLDYVLTFSGRALAIRRAHRAPALGLREPQ
jgi:cardiolipin synthase